MRKHVALAATLPLLAGRVFGYNLAVNWTITPDTPVQVAANLTDNGDGYRKFKVHLAMAQTCTELDSSRCQVSGPVCTLLDCVSTNVTGFYIPDGIPSIVGPTGLYYSLAYQLFDSPTTTFEAGLGYSNGWNDFTLLGTGEWTQYELEGHSMWDWNERVPCAAYDCARQCAQKLDAHSLPFGDPTMTACLKACPNNDKRQKGCITQNAFDGVSYDQLVKNTWPGLARTSPSSSTTSPTASSDSSPSATDSSNGCPPRLDVPLIAIAGPVLGLLVGFA